VILKQQNNADPKALCLLLIGATYRTLGDHSLALQSLWESYEHLSKQQKYTHALLSAAFTIAGIYSDRGNYDEALPLFEQLLSNAERFDNKLFIINACLGIGKIFIARKEYSTAKDFLTRASAVAEQLHASALIANTLTELAAYYTQTGDTDKAIELH